jgi:hypothetical protein
LGEEQGRQRRLSILHSKLESASLDRNLNLALAWRSSLLILVFGELPSQPLDRPAAVRPHAGDLLIRRP